MRCLATGQLRTSVAGAAVSPPVCPADDHVVADPKWRVPTDRNTEDP